MAEDPPKSATALAFRPPPDPVRTTADDIARAFVLARTRKAQLDRVKLCLQFALSGVKAGMVAEPMRQIEMALRVIEEDG